MNGEVSNLVRQHRSNCGTYILRASLAVFFTIFTLGYANAGPGLQPPPGSQPLPYYGEGFYNRVKAGERDDSLKQTLRIILEAVHISRPDRADMIVKACKVNLLSAGENCYRHQPLSYDAARRFLMGRLYLEREGREYAIHDVYCDRDVTENDFRKGPAPGPDVIPNSNILNTEHTWPQSRFTRRYPTSIQKSDLHHLFPTDSQMNGLRGNNKFAEIDYPARPLPCPESKYGSISGHNGMYFEPPDSHKGNVARALFYFSIRYAIQIDPDEERYLRKWHRQDPPDEEEITRHEAIYRQQRNRNPFIDYPQLTEAIADF